MTSKPAPATSIATLSQAAQPRMLQLPGEPFLFSGWKHAVFIHFETDAEVLQREVPFQLDLHDGKAYVSLVAFHLEKMKTRIGGRFSEWLMKPVATHEFLNIRTYVRHRGNNGIYFLAEYLPNKLSILFGPRAYGLPFREGKLVYQHTPQREISGLVTDGKNGLQYHAEVKTPLHLSEAERGSLDEFLLERYAAFTHRHGTKRFFHIWHPPWPQTPIDIELNDISLLHQTGRWMQYARYVGAHYSPGFEKVWMGFPRAAN